MFSTRVVSLYDSYPVSLVIRGALGLVAAPIFVTTASWSSSDDLIPVFATVCAILVMVENFEQPVAISRLQLSREQSSSGSWLGVMLGLPTALVSTVLVVTIYQNQGLALLAVASALLLGITGRAAVADFVGRGMVLGESGRRVNFSNLLRATSLLALIGVSVTSGPIWGLVAYTTVWLLSLGYLVPAASWSISDSTAVRHHFRLVLPLIAWTLGSVLSLQIDAISVSVFDPNSVTRFTFLVAVTSIPAAIQGLLLSASLPSLTYIFGQEGWKTIFQSLKLLIALSWGAVTLLMGSVYVRLGGMEAHIRSADFSLFVLASVVRQTTALFAVFLIASKQQSSVKLFAPLEGIVGMSVSAMLIATIGYRGAAVGTLLTSIVMILVYVTFVWKRIDTHGLERQELFGSPSFLAGLLGAVGVVIVSMGPEPMLFLVSLLILCSIMVMFLRNHLASRLSPAVRTLRRAR